MTYRLNHNAIRRVAERDFGIIGPVVIRRLRLCAMGVDDARAVLWLIQRDDAEYVKHTLHVNGDRSPARVAGSIAHELQHMADAEEIMRTAVAEDPTRDIREYLIPAHIPYRRRPSEVRARIAARTMGPVIERECIR